MSLGAFLWCYVRGYLGWVAAAIAVTLLFAVSTLLLLALLRPIFGEVLLAEEEMPESLQAISEPAADEGSEPRTEEKGEEGVGDEVKAYLVQLFDRAYLALRELFGIDDENVVVRLPILFATAFLLRAVLAFLNGYLFQVIGLGATNDLRNDLYRRILHQSSRFFASHPSGELVSRVGYDVSVMQSAVSNRLLDLFQQSVTLLALVWYLVSTEPRLALVCLVVVPALFVPIVRFGKGIRRTSHRSQERLAEVSNLVAEAVRGHRVVKAFGMEGFEAERFRGATRRHLRVSLRAQLLAHGSGPVMESLIAIGAAAFLIYAGRIVRAGELQASEVVAFLTTLVMLYDPIRKLNKVNLILQESLAAAHRVKQVVSASRDVEERPGAVALRELRREVRFARVTFAYEDEPVLYGVELTIRRGEVVALVGPSGAGKSTLVNLLPRFFDPVEGAIEIDGVDIRDVTLESLRSQIGLVTQETVLFNDTVRHNIAYGRSDLPLERVREAARAAFADEFIEEMPLGYETVIGEGGFKLSGGQRQRLAIARAVLKDPPILILDEATSHLDSRSEALVQKALSNLMRGRTALVIAHRLSTVQRAARIVVMEEGRIVEQGSHHELLAAGGLYRRFYDLQFRDDA